MQEAIKQAAKLVQLGSAIDVIRQRQAGFRCFVGQLLNQICSLEGVGIHKRQPVVRITVAVDADPGWAKQGKGKAALVPFANQGE